MKYNCDIRTSEVLNFLTLKKNLVTVGLSFLLASISAIISSITNTNTSLFFVELYFSKFL